MKAFWWFKENSIAGMARPGFNSTRWLELPFDEAVLLGWIGQFSSSSSQSLEAFQRHVSSYGPKVGKFHGVDDRNFEQAIRPLQTEEGITGVLRRLRERTQIFTDGSASKGQIHFEFSERRLQWEIDALKRQGIGAIITLTERPHSHEILHQHFDVHHFSIEDLNAPQFEQAQALASVIKNSGSKKLAVHCLAGIGRTSTMLMTAHMILGEKQSELLALLKKQNTSFALSPPQLAFVQFVAEKIREN